MSKRIFLGVLAFTALQAKAQNCGGASNPKRRVIITFNGDDDEKLFARNTNVVAKEFVHPQDLFLRLENTKASPAGLLAAGDRIKADFEAAKKALGPDFKPSDYQVVWFVGSHGNVSLSKNGAATYGIGSYRTSPIGAQTMAEFAKRLPPGVNLIPIMDQCFGADAMRILEKAVRDADASNCFCGASQAATGSMSYAYDNAAMTFGGRMARVAATKQVTFAQDVWDNYWHMAGSGLVGYRQFRESMGPDNNAPMSTSERLVSQYLLTHLRRQGQDLSWEDLESNPSLASKLPRASHEIPGLKEALQTSDAQRSAFLEAKRREDRESGPVDHLIERLRDPMKKGKLISLGEVTKAHEECEQKTSGVRFGQGFDAQALQSARAACEKYEMLDIAAAKIEMNAPAQNAGVVATADAGGPSFDMSQPWRRPEMRARAQRLVNRGILEKEFVNTAPIEVVERFLALRQCELRPFGLGGIQAPTANTPPPASSH